jgi:hypothetical protein
MLLCGGSRDGLRMGSGIKLHRLFMLLYGRSRDGLRMGSGIKCAVCSVGVVGFFSAELSVWVLSITEIRVIWTCLHFESSKFLRLMSWLTTLPDYKRRI